MNAADRREGAAILSAVLDSLLAEGGDRAGRDGAELRRLVGALRAEVLERVETGDFGPYLRACFRAGTGAGATFDGMARVWATASGYQSDRPTAARVAQTCIRYALVEMSLILSATEFNSRSDAEAALLRINAVYVPALDFAADQGSTDVWRALTGLHAATVRDLTRRAKQLPRLIIYAVARRAPALTLANRLYGDGARFEELIAENKAVHPLFMPSAGRALSI